MFFFQQEEVRREGAGLVPGFCGNESVTGRVERRLLGTDASRPNAATNCYHLACKRASTFLHAPVFKGIPTFWSQGLPTSKEHWPNAGASTPGPAAHLECFSSCSSPDFKVSCGKWLCSLGKFERPVLTALAPDSEQFKNFQPVSNCGKPARKCKPMAYYALLGSHH